MVTEDLIKIVSKGATVRRPQQMCGIRYQPPV